MFFLTPSNASQFKFLFNQCATVIFISTPTLSHAIESEKTNQIIDFGSTVISATKTERLAIDAPIKVEVVSNSTLQKNHIRTLKEALAHVPGLQFRKIHGKTGYEVLMQGLSADRVLVLIDGLPISASTGSTVNLNQYTNMAIERIEIIKGAASAQYGSAAMGGVINVITQGIASKPQAHFDIQTRTYGDQNSNGKPLTANVNSMRIDMAGSLRTLKNPQSKKNNKYKYNQQWLDNNDIRVRFSANTIDDKGLSTDPDHWPWIQDASKQAQYKLDLGWYQIDADHQTNVNKPRLWLSADYYIEEDEGRYNRFVPPRTLAYKKQEDIKRKRVTAGGNFNIDRHQLKAEVLHENYDSNSDLSVVTSSSSNITQVRRAKLTTNVINTQWDLPKGQNHAVQFGLSHRKDKLKQHKNNITEIAGDGATSTAWDIYGQHSWFFYDDWELLSGLRAQFDKQFDWHYSPKIAVRGEILELGDWVHSMRASISGGYRVPNLKDRYFLFDHSNLGYRVLGNANLKPETSISYQLGWHAYMAMAQIDANLFYNQLDDLIQTGGSPSVENGIANYTYENVDKAHTYGAEISTQWQPNRQLALTAAYTHTNTKNESNRKPLVRRPKHIGKLGVTWQMTDKFELLTNASLQSKELINVETNAHSPAWALFDVKTNYQIMPELNIYGGIDNIFNRQRDFDNEDDVGPVTGRAFYLGSQLTW